MPNKVVHLLHTNHYRTLRAMLKNMTLNFLFTLNYLPQKRCASLYVNVCACVCVCARGLHVAVTLISFHLTLPTNVAVTFI